MLILSFASKRAATLIRFFWRQATLRTTRNKKRKVLRHERACTHTHTGKMEDQHGCVSLCIRGPWQSDRSTQDTHTHRLTHRLSHTHTHTDLDKMAPQQTKTGIGTNPY